MVLHHFPGPEVGDGRAEDAGEVDALVVIEIAVLGSDKGLTHVLGHFLQPAQEPFLLEQVPQDLPVAGEDGRGQGRVVVGNLLNAGQVPGYPVIQPGAPHEEEKQQADCGGCENLDRCSHGQTGLLYNCLRVA
jgi:hypothetical protein